MYFYRILLNSGEFLANLRKFRQFCDFNFQLYLKKKEKKKWVFNSSISKTAQPILDWLRKTWKYVEKLYFLYLNLYKICMSNRNLCCSTFDYSKILIFKNSFIFRTAWLINSWTNSYDVKVHFKKFCFNLPLKVPGTPTFSLEWKNYKNGETNFNEIWYTRMCIDCSYISL